MLKLLIKSKRTPDNASAKESASDHDALNKANSLQNSLPYDSSLSDDALEKLSLEAEANIKESLKLGTPINKVTDLPFLVPNHLAIIMDGNGRWAKNRGSNRIIGHSHGSKAVTRTVETCAQWGVKTLTLFAFSSENWKRPVSEVNGLMALFAKVLRSERDRLHENGIRVRFCGDISKFSDSLKEAIYELEKLTMDNHTMNLNIAINYGGRWDVMQATKAIVKDVKAGLINEDDITEDLIKSRLSVNEDVDLLIRTGGEFRISNFLLFQCAYSEFYISELLWPDFGALELAKSFRAFSSRERRFGMTSEQVNAK